MNWLQTLALICHMLFAIGIVGLVLLQRGKGADAGAGFGAGASGTVFGARGSASFLTRATAVLATLFFITSLTLAYFGGKPTTGRSVTDTIPAVTVPAITPADAAKESEPRQPDLPATAPAEGAPK
jgi:preprotein translocase subunit SecG